MPTATDVPESAARTMPRNGRTPLHLAAQNPNLAEGAHAVQDLLRGLDARQAFELSTTIDATWWGDTPAHGAARRDNHAALRHMVQAASQGGTQLAHALITMRNAASETPMHVAARCGHAATIAMLLDAVNAMGAQAVLALLTMPSLDLSRSTPLHLAARSGNASAVHALLAAADQAGDHSTLMQVSNAANAHRNTPLHLAALSGNAELAQLLLDSGANASLRYANRKEWLPRDCAFTMWGGDSAVYRLLA